VLVVSSTLPVNSVKELIAYAKANPGRLNYGSGTNSFFFATELFKQKTGIDILHIPYKGNSQTVTALLAGEVQMAIVDVTPVLAHIRSGKPAGARRHDLSAHVSASGGTNARRGRRHPRVRGRALDRPVRACRDTQDIVERLNLSVVRSLNRRT
jgi:hypothetical protein